MDSREYLIELRTSTGMTRREFCEYFEIPYRTPRTGNLETAKCRIICCDLWLIRLRWKKLAEEKN